MVRIWRHIHSLRIRSSKPITYGYHRWYSIWDTNTKVGRTSSMAHGTYHKSPRKSDDWLFVNYNECALDSNRGHLDILITPYRWDFLLHYHYRYTFWQTTFKTCLVSFNAFWPRNYKEISVHYLLVGMVSPTQSTLQKTNS